MPKYDIVVVGAGNAGLSAALQCQLAGRKTLLIEKHNVPGGAATSFVRGRFEIEPSLDVRNILDGYGVKLDWYECKDCFRIVSKYSDGSPMDVTMPAGIEAFIDKMEVYVPGSREKMESLFALFQEVLDGISYITASKGHADSKVLQADYPNMLRTGAYSTQKVFNALKLPKKCQDRIFSPLTGATSALTWSTWRSSITRLWYISTSPAALIFLPIPPISFPPPW